MNVSGTAAKMSVWNELAVPPAICEVNTPLQSLVPLASVTVPVAFRPIENPPGVLVSKKGKVEAEMMQEVPGPAAQLVPLVGAEGVENPVNLKSSPPNFMKSVPGEKSRVRSVISPVAPLDKGPKVDVTLVPAWELIHPVPATLPTGRN